MFAAAVLRPIQVRSEGFAVQHRPTEVRSEGFSDQQRPVEVAREAPAGHEYGISDYTQATPSALSHDTEGLELQVTTAAMLKAKMKFICTHSQSSNCICVCVILFVLVCVCVSVCVRLRFRRDWCKAYCDRGRRRGFAGGD